MFDYLAYPDGPPEGRSPTSGAIETLRLCPHGVRQALRPVAVGDKTVDELPVFAAEWCVKHGLISRSKRPDSVWTKSRKFRSLLASLKEHYR